MRQVKHLGKYLLSSYGAAEEAKHRQAGHAFAEHREELRQGIKDKSVTLEQLTSCALAPPATR